MRTRVIVCGYVGLVTGGCRSAMGHEVICAHNDFPKIQPLERGRLSICESHLDKFVAKGRHEGWLRSTGDMAEAGNVVRRICFIQSCLLLLRLRGRLSDGIFPPRGRGKP